MGGTNKNISQTPKNTPTVAPSLARFQDDSPIATNKDKEWQEDERLVRLGKSCFKVKYIGYIEVKEARGMEICEKAVEELKKYKKINKKSKLSFTNTNNNKSSSVVSSNNNQNNNIYQLNNTSSSQPIRNIIQRMSFRKSKRSFKNRNQLYNPTERISESTTTPNETPRDQIIDRNIP